MKTFLIAILVSVLMNMSTWAQTRVIEGFVTTLNDLSVSNMRITAKKAGSAVLTDSLGRFTIVTNNKDILQITSRDNLFNHSKVRINRR
ncbi:MAG: hypothetical protein LC643_00050, partial [Bacteroidales bacterium]|nr:hypothetical protein [Bacteroidales bacterium]